MEDRANVFQWVRGKRRTFHLNHKSLTPPVEKQLIRSPRQDMGFPPLFCKGETRNVKRRTYRDAPSGREGKRKWKTELTFFSG